MAEYRCLDHPEHMTIKQKADAYDKAVLESSYWRALATVGDRLAQGRAGAPGLFALASQEHETLKRQDPESFGRSREEAKARIVAKLRDIEDLTAHCKKLINETY